MVLVFRGTSEVGIVVILLEADSVVVELPVLRANVCLPVKAGAVQSSVAGKGEVRCGSHYNKRDGALQYRNGGQSEGCRALISQD